MATFLLTGTANNSQDVIELGRDEEITASDVSQRLALSLWEALGVVNSAVESGQLILAGCNAYKLNTTEHYLSVTADVSGSDSLIMHFGDPLLWEIFNDLEDGECLNIESVEMTRLEYRNLVEWEGF